MIAQSTPAVDRSVPPAILGSQIQESTSYGGDEFLPFDLRLFVAGRPPMLDLYHYVGGQYVLYCKARSTLTDDSRLRLIEHGVAVLYIRIRSGQISAGGVGLADLLSMPDSTLPRVVKSALVYRSALSGARAVFNATTPSSTISAAQRVVSATVGFIASSPGTLQSVVALMQHDSSLYSHSVNVCAYAVALGRQGGRSNSELQSLGLGAFVHDVGKSKVPRSVLSKPGELTRDEVKIVRRHPQWGCELLGEEAGRRPEMRSIVLLHHERVDGSGYPFGLAGEKIPALARIVALADVYDALTSDRPQRPAMSPFEALQVMRNEMAGKFDQGMFVAFVQMLAYDSASSDQEVRSGP